MGHTPLSALSLYRTTVNYGNRLFTVDVEANLSFVTVTNVKLELKRPRIPSHG